MTGPNTKYALDPEIASALAALTTEVGPPPTLARGDWKSLRDEANKMLAHLASRSPTYPEVEIKSFSTHANDGALIALRWYSKKASSTGEAVIYAHGGGTIAGTLDHYDSVISQYVSESGVPFLSVDYRLAPEVKGATLAEDAFAGLLWLRDHASELGVDPARIAMMGDSAGGGIAAGVAILARDRGVKLRKQILIYPMLDDRNIQPSLNTPSIEAFLTWTYENNFTVWNTFLGADFGSDQVSAVAAPARLQNAKGLAPAYIEVGELDIFQDEAVGYAKKLQQAGVAVELQVRAGAPHCFDTLAPACSLTAQAMRDRVRAIRPGA